MRPLVMDFNGDTSALNQQFEYMFGKAFLVNPVTEPNVKEWNVYLPKSGVWYDFWTGKNYKGGQTIKTAATLDIVPLFVKAGSIIPMGKFIQYAGQKSADTIEIRIYKGANGRFDLYEDQGDNYNYEKGIYSTIDFKWSDAATTLNIGKRQGHYPGMLMTRTFKIVIVSPDHGTGVNETDKIEKIVNYNGTEKKIVF